MTKENLLNVFGLPLSFGILSEYLSTGLSLIAAVTLIWMNVERALRARNNRKNEQNTHDE
jgi:preprotein translocase subunit SecF